MKLPDYWLTRPHTNFDESTQIAFDELLDKTLSANDCPTIQFTLPWPKWQFLCYLADHHDIALHGSGDANIALFEPRQPSDLTEFGNQKAVYAASDGLWAMFFAIVDRSHVMSITNACIRLEEETGAVYGPLYVFSVSQSALASQPWRTGTVYSLTGIFYNKTLATQIGMAAPPQTLAEFEDLLAKAKEAGLQPIMIWGSAKSGMGLAFPLQALMASVGPTQPINDWIFQKKDATIDTPDNLVAAQHLEEWIKNGYFPSDINAIEYTDAAARFGAIITALLQGAVKG